jgi:diguanylate cyclase (GGDEF)-like protein
MRLIAAKLSQIVPYDCCALFLPDPEGETLRCRFAWGRDQEIIERVTVKIGKGLAGWVARARRPLVNGRPCMDTAEATTLQSALVYPLLSHDRFIGALALYDVEPDCYSEEHSRLLSHVANQMAAAIANSQIFDQAQEDSLTDPLTGLPNTRSLFMHMTRELARARRLQATLALLVIDLDDFKRINDRFGHHVGDRALCEVARVLRTAIRPYDICVRYAGDEFILVLAGCSPEEGRRKHGDLQKTVAGTPFESRPGVQLPLSVSVGVAMYPEDGDTYEKLLAAADRRMYTDKTRRTRRATRGAADPTYSEGELESSAGGVL